MTNQQKLQAITEAVESWKAGGITDSVAMIVIADLVAPQPVTASDVQWAESKRREIEAAAEYDQRREK